MRAALILLLLAGCPRAPRPAEPPVVSAALEAGTLRLSVENANPWPLHAEAVDWELAADEEPLARGRVELDLSLPARAVTLVPVELRLSPVQSARFAEAAQENRALSVSGTLHTRGPGGRGFAGDFWQASR